MKSDIFIILLQIKCKQCYFSRISLKINERYVCMCETDIL